MIRLSFPLAVALAGALAVGGAIVLNVSDDTDETAPASVADSAAEPAQTGDQTGDQTRADEPAAPAPDGDAVPTSPTFDVVRVDKDGSTVIAGRAQPGATVDIRRDDTVIGQVEADERGEWVFVPDEAMKPGNALLSLAMRPKDDDVVVPSEEDVVVIVPSAEAETDAARDPDDPNATKTAEPSQAVVLKVTKDGTSTLMQHPEPTVVAEGEMVPLSIDTVDYDDVGRISIGGRAPANSDIVLYIDNGVVGRANAGEAGTWRVTPEIAVEPGVHTVRADRIDDGGDVLARVMIPFSREAFDEPLAAGDFVIVQPGNSLWRLARRTYGSGFAYTVIYRANAEQIGDPDLIYPGQIFKLPATN